MAVYKAPLKDINFVLNEVLDVSSLAKLPGYEDATPDTIQAILEEAAKLCENVLFPLNRTGDEEGCTYENGVVRTPKGFKDAYDMFREGGWTAVTCDPEYGGQGLPATVGFAVQEMFTASNQAFAMYPGPEPRRLRGAVAARLGRAQEALPAQAHRRHLVGHDVPHRAPLRHRSRHAAHQGRAAGRRQLLDHRHQDLHLGRRARSHREHPPSRAGAPAGCAGRHQGHLALPGAEVPAQGRRQRGRAQRHPLRRHRAQDGHQGQRDLRHEFRRRQGLAGRRAEQGHAGDVRDDERRAARRRHAGPRHRRDRLPERRRLCARPPAGPLADRARRTPLARPIRSSSIPTCGACC